VKCSAGAPDSVDKVKELAASGKIKLELNSNITNLHGNGKLESVTISNNDGTSKEIEADHYLALFGLSPKLGPIANWGLSIEKNAINVDTRDYSTNEKGIYAIGDINNYEGKIKAYFMRFPRSCYDVPKCSRINFRKKTIAEIYYS
jgi:thioredoxin reductase (NADPH)